MSTATAKVESQHEKDARTFHSTNAAYVLPNDTIEHQRLEYQHKVLHRFMGNKIFHAPLNNNTVRKAIDIGCGTGVVTHEMATAFPAAEIYGIDISPIPEVRPKLPNISYIQGNIMEIDESKISKESFDFIFSRLLVMGMTNWKGYVERCAALAKPGGWVEMHDFDVRIRQVPASISSLDKLRPHSVTLDQIKDKTHPTDAYDEEASWTWEPIFSRLLALRGADGYCGARMPFWFAEAGLVDIRITRYMVPFSRWEGLTPEEKGFGDIMQGFLKQAVPLCINKASESAGPEYTHQVEEALADAKKHHDSYDEVRHFMWMYVVCGKKPE